ncbi:hypothetical protein LTR48_009464, partial [Friedmanniomyces endolithicus]
ILPRHRHRHLHRTLHLPASPLNHRQLHEPHLVRLSRQLRHDQQLPSPSRQQLDARQRALLRHRRRARHRDHHHLLQTRQRALRRDPHRRAPQHPQRQRQLLQRFRWA